MNCFTLLAKHGSTKAQFAAADCSIQNENPCKIYAQEVLAEFAKFNG